MIIQVPDFETWKQLARTAIIRSISPDTIRFIDEDDQTILFENEEPLAGEKNAKFVVPRAFLELAANIAYHRDSSRWNLLYRTLWRLQHDEPHLLDITTDDDVYRLTMMEKQVLRDAHKMKAFVRFRQVIRGGVKNYVAWHRSDHRVLRKVAPFFSRRFKAMNWTILTPDESVSWDQSMLHYGPGVPRSEAPDFEGYAQTAADYIQQYPEAARSLDALDD